jgi:hypothetical protein
LTNAASSTDTGVVDQNIEPVGRALYCGGKIAHFGQASQVGSKEGRCTTRSFGIGNDLGTSVRVAAMHHHPGPSIAKATSNETTDAIGRSGDKHRTSLQVFQADLAP